MRLKILCLASLACGFHAAHGQDTRADTAARTTASLQRTQAATEVVAQADADLGTLEPIRARPSPLGAYLIGNASLYYTSNPSLSSEGGRGDMYFVGGGGVGARPNVAGGLYLDGHVSDQVFQYAQFSSLNFNYFNAGGGLDYVFENLGQLTASVRFEYQRYLDSETLDEFYVNNAVTVGLYKAFQLNDAMTLQAGWLGLLPLPPIPLPLGGTNTISGWAGGGASLPRSNYKPITSCRSFSILKLSDSMSPTMWGPLSISRSHVGPVSQLAPTLEPTTRQNRSSIIP